MPNLPDDISPEQRKAVYDRIAMLNPFHAAAQASVRAIGIPYGHPSDTSAVDKTFEGYKAQAMQPITDAAEARKRAIEDQSYGMKQQEFEQGRMHLADLKSQMDPNSDESKFHTGAVADFLDTQAMHSPEVAKILGPVSQQLRSGTVSAMTANRTVPSTYGKIGEEAVHYAQQAAAAKKEAAAEEQRKAEHDRLVGRDEQTALYQQGMLKAALQNANTRQNNIGLKAKVASTKDQRELASNIADISRMQGLIPKLVEMEPGTDLGSYFDKANDTEAATPGLLVGAARGLANTVGAGALVPSEEQHKKYNEFHGPLQIEQQKMRLAVEKTVRNNPYLLKQLDSVLIKKTDNNETVRGKLALYPEILDRLMAAKMSELQMDDDGSPLDKSLVVQNLGGEPQTSAKALNDKRQEAKPAAAIVPAPAASTKQAAAIPLDEKTAARLNRALQALNDPEALPSEKAAARRIVDKAQKHGQ